MMALCSNTDPKKNSASLVLSLFAVGIVYQFTFNYVPTNGFHGTPTAKKGRRIREIAGTGTWVASATDLQESEGECTESKLFKMWNAEAEAERVVFKDVGKRFGMVENHTLATGQANKTQEIHKDA